MIKKNLFVLLLLVGCIYQSNTTSTTSATATTATTSTATTSTASTPTVAQWNAEEFARTELQRQVDLEKAQLEAEYQAELRKLNFEIAEAALLLEYCNWYCVQSCVNVAIGLVAKAECLNDCGCYEGNYDHLVYSASLNAGTSVPSNSLQALYSESEESADEYFASAEVTVETSVTTTTIEQEEEALIATAHEADVQAQELTSTSTCNEEELQQVAQVTTGYLSQSVKDAMVESVLTQIFAQAAQSTISGSNTQFTTSSQTVAQDFNDEITQIVDTEWGHVMGVAEQGHEAYCSCPSAPEDHVHVNGEVVVLETHADTEIHTHEAEGEVHVHVEDHSTEHGHVEVDGEAEGATAEVTATATSTTTTTTTSSTTAEAHVEEEVPHDHDVQVEDEAVVAEAEVTKEATVTTTSTTTVVEEAVVAEPTTAEAEVTQEATVTATSTTTVVEGSVSGEATTAEEEVAAPTTAEEEVVIVTATVSKDEKESTSTCGAAVEVAPEEQVQKTGKQLESELTIFKEELLNDLKGAISREIDAQWNAHIAEIGRILYEEETQPVESEVESDHVHQVTVDADGVVHEEHVEEVSVDVTADAQVTTGTATATSTTTTTTATATAEKDVAVEEEVVLESCHADHTHEVVVEEKDVDAISVEVATLEVVVEGDAATQDATKEATVEASTTTTTTTATTTATATTGTTGTATLQEEKPVATIEAEVVVAEEEVVEPLYVTPAISYTTDSWAVGPSLYIDEHGVQQTGHSQKFVTEYVTIIEHPSILAAEDEISVSGKSSSKLNDQGMVSQITTVVTEQLIATTDGKQVITVTETTTVDDIRTADLAQEQSKTVTVEADAATVEAEAVATTTTTTTTATATAEKDAAVTVDADASLEVDVAVATVEADKEVVVDTTTTATKTTTTTKESTQVSGEITQDELDTIHTATKAPVSTDCPIHVEEVATVRTGISTDTTKEVPADEKAVATLTAEVETTTTKTETTAATCAAPVEADATATATVTATATTTTTAATATTDATANATQNATADATVQRPSWMSDAQYLAYLRQAAHWHLEQKEMALDAAQYRAQMELDAMERDYQLMGHRASFQEKLDLLQAQQEFAALEHELETELIVAEMETEIQFAHPFERAQVQTEQQNELRQAELEWNQQQLTAQREIDQLKAVHKAAQARAAQQGIDHIHYHPSLIKETLDQSVAASIQHLEIAEAASTSSIDNTLHQFAYHLQCDQKCVDSCSSWQNALDQKAYCLDKCGCYSAYGTQGQSLAGTTEEHWNFNNFFIFAGVLLSAMAAYYFLSKKDEKKVVMVGSFDDENLNQPLLKQ